MFPFQLCYFILPNFPQSLPQLSAKHWCASLPMSCSQHHLSLSHAFHSLWIVNLRWAGPPWHDSHSKGIWPWRLACFLSSLWQVSAHIFPCGLLVSTLATLGLCCLEERPTVSRRQGLPSCRGKVTWSSQLVYSLHIGLKVLAENCIFATHAFRTDVYLRFVREGGPELLGRRILTQVLFIYESVNIE